MRESSSSSARRAVENKRLNAFRAWVQSLTWEEMQSAMALSFPLESSSNKKHQHNSVSTFRATTVTGNVELDLLYEMIREQVPRPTPIHGRAVPYPAASANQCSDGRNEAQRIRRDRWQRPRYFHWRTETSSSSHNKRYKVHALSFRQADGERLTVGCTWEQQQADAALLLHSMLGQAPDGTATTLEFCLSDHDTKSDGGDAACWVRRLLTVASRGQFLSQLPTPVSATSSNSKNKHTATAALTIHQSPWLDPTDQWFSLSMYLASRFELALWHSFCSNSNTGSAKRISPTTTTTPWWPGIDTLLSETNVEYAIVKSITNEIESDLHKHRKKDGVSVLMDSLVWDLVADNVTASATAFSSSSSRSCNKHPWVGILGGMDSNNHRSAAGSPQHEQQQQQYLHGLGGGSSAMKRLLQSIVYCPITDVGTRREGLQRAARQSIQQLFVEATERSLLQLEEEAQNNVPSSVSSSSPTRDNNNRGNKKKNKRNKARKRKKSSGKQPSVPDQQSMGTAQQQNEEEVSVQQQQQLVKSKGHDDVLEEESCEEEEEEHLTSSDETNSKDDDEDHVISFPDNKTPTRERNRNIVMAFAVLDVVLENVFAQVDCGDDDDENDLAPVSQPEEKESLEVSVDLEPGTVQQVEPVEKELDAQALVPAPQVVIEEATDEGGRKKQEKEGGKLSQNKESEPDVPDTVSNESSKDDEEDDDGSDDELSMSYSVAASVPLSCGEKESDASRSTQSPTLSPILLSLSGLSEMRKDSKEQDGMKMPSVVRSISSVSALSLPGTSELRSSHHQMIPGSNSAVSPVRGVDDGREGDTEKITAASQGESLDTSNIREERDSYRDMCLTLGAEVAKLKNMLAAQKGTAHDTNMDFSSPGRNQFYRSHGSFDPESLPQAFDIVPRARTLAAMSDAGFRGEHESQASEDDAARLLRGESSRHLSSVATAAGSDVSVDHGSNHGTGASHLHPSASGSAPFARVVYDPVSMHGMQSRLTTDIYNFLEATSTQLQKQEPRRQNAIVRMTRLVNTVWPRAQVKLYGSLVNGLSLPSSDLDFVICLPAVHKNALAVAPGVLEGRNAINETSQKLLARTLSGESWIDPRSMKLIERTPVPVIKVSTKGSRSRALHLDITFDSPGHHGLAALHMVSQVMEDLPMLRPLVIVLKQFLNNRGLLTSYTGGLSSYGLFLMVARYLQEEPSSWGDCGSLLMGFLDFYGNNFDPRSTGISVRHRRYFARQASEAMHGPAASPLPAAWRPLGLGGTPTTSFRRRNSFSLDVEANASDPQRLPYTLDPLWLEDPLNESNNVGRNAFRILSVLRAFSDAHRALVASLEWDMQSAGEFHDDGRYPLLKCLLQNEDVVFGL